MANWKRRIDLVDLWEEGSPKKLATSIAKQLTKMESLGPIEVEDERIRLKEEFQILSEQEVVTESEFDDLLEELYDWGDTALDDNPVGRKVCWVARF